MKALVVIDMLNDFVEEDGKLPVKGAKELIPRIKRLIEAARMNDVPVIYANDSHDPDDKEFERWPKHSVEGTKGAEVTLELKPEKEDIIIPKKDLCMFTNKDAIKVLDKKGIQELYITGMATEYCVRHAVISDKDKYGDHVKAGAERFKINIVVDTIKGIDLRPGDSAKALIEMGAAGARPIFAEEAEKELSS